MVLRRQDGTHAIYALVDATVLKVLLMVARAVHADAARLAAALRVAFWPTQGPPCERNALTGRSGVVVARPPELSATPGVAPRSGRGARWRRHDRSELVPVRGDPASDALVGVAIRGALA